MKILNSNSKNFYKTLDSLLLQRKKKVQSNSVSVISIINDIKKNRDKALLKYEKRFNQNNIIVPASKQISKLIKSLDKKVKQAIDLAYRRIYKFHSLQKVKNILYTDDLKNKCMDNLHHISEQSCPLQYLIPKHAFTLASFPITPTPCPPPKAC